MAYPHPPKLSNIIEGTWNHSNSMNVNVFPFQKTKIYFWPTGEINNNLILLMLVDVNEIHSHIKPLKKIATKLKNINNSKRKMVQDL